MVSGQSLLKTVLAGVVAYGLTGCGNSSSGKKKVEDPIDEKEVGLRLLDGFLIQLVLVRQPGPPLMPPPLRPLLLPRHRVPPPTGLTVSNPRRRASARESRNVA